MSLVKDTLEGLEKRWKDRFFVLKKLAIFYYAITKTDIVEFEEDVQVLDDPANPLPYLSKNRRNVILGESTNMFDGINFKNPLHGLT